MIENRKTRIEESASVMDELFGEGSQTAAEPLEAAASPEVPQEAETARREVSESKPRSARRAAEPVNDDDIVIKVIGVGGGGGNAINTMVESKLAGVEFIAANTDMQALSQSLAPVRMQLGKGTTRGMGAGADPERGRDAAQESYDELLAALDGAHMVFITAGLGGGTGTGAVPVIAKACKEVGALTVAVVSKPFYFEGKKRMRNAEAGWEALREHADTIITVPNDRLLSLMNKNSTMHEMMVQVDHVLLQAVRGITDLIKLPGHINVDFEDLKTVMREVGPAIMGTGTASGETRAVEAAKAAIDNQLLEDVGIDGARAVLINISASMNTLNLSEFQEASALIQEKAHEDATIILGVLYDESLGDEMRVTVIATGISSKEEAVPVGRPGLRRAAGAAATGMGQGQSPFGTRLRTTRTSFDGALPHQTSFSGRGEAAQPNPRPRGLTDLGMTRFDEDDLLDQSPIGRGSAQFDETDLEDTPAFLRKRAN